MSSGFIRSMEPCVESLIFRADRADEHLAAIRELMRLFPLVVGYGLIAQGTGGWIAGYFDLDPRVEHNHSLVIE